MNPTFDEDVEDLACFLSGRPCEVHDTVTRVYQALLRRAWAEGVTEEERERYAHAQLLCLRALLKANGRAA